MLIKIRWVVRPSGANVNDDMSPVTVDIINKACADMFTSIGITWARMRRQAKVIVSTDKKHEQGFFIMSSSNYVKL